MNPVVIDHDIATLHPALRGGVIQQGQQVTNSRMTFPRAEAMPSLAGSQIERTGQRVFFMLPWRPDCCLAPLGHPRRPDFGHQRDRECLRKDQPLMRLHVLGMPPNPGQALAPLWIVLLRHQFGALPPPAYFMAPASNG